MSKLTKTILVIFLLSANVFSFAQEKMLSTHDAIYMNRDIYPVSVRQLQWIGDLNDYAFVEKNSVYKTGAKNGSQTLLFDMDVLNQAMNKNGYDSIKRLPGLHFYGNQNCSFSVNNKYFDYNFVTDYLSQVNAIPEGAENTDYETNTRFIAYTIDNNLYYSVDGKSKQVTFDDNKEIVNGQTVHRVEFGITKGIFWSPESKKLAYYRKDESMVTDYPLVDVNTRIAEVENTKYPMAGMTSHQVTLNVYNLATGETVTMKTGEHFDQYLTAVTWGPEGKFIYIGILNRDQDHLKLNKYDAATGDFVQTLFEEKSEAYVEPQHPLYFMPNRKDHFIWQSRRDGWNHMYLYNTKGELVQQLTKGEWEVTELIGLKGDGKLWFTSTEESPLQNNLYSVKPGSDKILRVTPDHGTHTTFVSTSGKYIIDIFSSTDVARQYQLLNSKGKVVRIIKENVDPLADYNLGEMSIFTLKSDNDDDLYCRMIKPVDFDSTKKYPVIVYVYGGPHAQMITDSWLGSAGLYLNYLAQQGYLVWTLDNRGSANRGLEFEQSIYRNLGVLEVADQMVGVDYLKSLPYVDAERIGVDGWSYGGFMTINLMLSHPEVFKVGVAGGPVIDWQYYEIMYGERYMDTPEQNPEGYENANLLNKIDNLNGKLMIIHGTSDPTVVWQHSLQFVKTAIEKGKQMDYFVYPGHGHNVRGIDRAHLYTKITNYFNDYLK